MPTPAIFSAKQNNNKTHKINTFFIEIIKTKIKLNTTINTHLIIFDHGNVPCCLSTACMALTKTWQFDSAYSTNTNNNFNAVLTTER